MTCGLSLILRDKRLLQAFKNCTRLANVFISFDCMDAEDITTSFNCFMPLDCFQNLTSLELMNFRVEVSRSSGSRMHAAKAIASLLSRSPNLKNLGLGMACRYSNDIYWEVVIIDDDCFLEDLCVLYGSKGQGPLSLDTLRLGHGLYLLETTKSVENQDFLQKLVNVASLKTLHIFNDSVVWDGGDEEPEALEIDWKLLHGCDSLHQLAVSRLEPDVRRWLNSQGQSVQELFVAHDYLQYGKDLDEFDRLELPHLTALGVFERTVAHTSDSDSDSEVNSELDWDSEREEQLMTYKPRSSPRKYDRSVITIVDRLHDGGAQLNALRICFDFETQWVCLISYPIDTFC